MRKELKTLKTAAAALLALLSAKTALADEPVVCAAVQTYAALEAVRDLGDHSFKAVYAPDEDLASEIGNGERRCSLVVSSGEKLPVLLIRSQQAAVTYLTPLVRAPLVLWSADPALLDSQATAVGQKRLRSLALPQAALTPAGYAAAQIVSRKNFPTGYLKGRIYRPEQEYQVLAMVDSGNVQAGFLTLPLILGKDGKPRGSWWQVPRDLYDELDYYLIPTLSGAKDREAMALYKYLKSDPTVLKAFENAGFAKTEHP